MTDGTTESSPTITATGASFLDDLTLRLQSVDLSIDYYSAMRLVGLPESMTDADLDQALAPEIENSTPLGPIPENLKRMWLCKRVVSGEILTLRRALHHTLQAEFQGEDTPDRFAEDDPRMIEYRAKSLELDNAQALYRVLTELFNREIRTAYAGLTGNFMVHVDQNFQIYVSWKKYEELIPSDIIGLAFVTAVGRAAGNRAVN